MRRGMYNNNPFNIPFVSEKLWLGKVPEHLNTDFNHQYEQFRSLDYGIRAGILMLRHYISSGCRTVSGLVHCLCGESFTDHYLNYIIDRLNESCRYYKAGGYDPSEGIWLVTTEEDWSPDSVVYAFTDGFFVICLAVMEYESGYFTTLDAVKNISNSFNLM